jgi:putative ABC transport system ATP-binding protein
MLELENIRKVFRTSEVETVALNEVTVNIASGEFVAMMGPSGCGKSTLLNMIGLLDNPSSGSYRFFDEEVATQSEAKLARLRKENIGFVFQSFNLIDELSVYRNVELPLVYQKVHVKQRRERVEATLEKVGILSRRDHIPQQLSGGQQQRVAVARAIIANPRLILADEPTGNLDSENGAEVMNLLVQLNAEGTTIVMVTHSQAHAEYARRTIRMLDGQVVTENQVAGTENQVRLPLAAAHA